MRAVERHLVTLLGYQGLPTGMKFIRSLLESKKHLEAIKELPCCVTGHEADHPHHVQRVSQGRNDYTCIPLRADVHTYLHSPSPTESFEDKFNAEEKDLLIAVLINHILRLEGKI